MIVLGRRFRRFAWRRRGIYARSVADLKGLERTIGEGMCVKMYTQSSKYELNDNDRLESCNISDNGVVMFVVCTRIKRLFVQQLQRST